MKIIRDSKKLINLHPLMAYFMLTEDAYKHYRDELKKFNRCGSIHRGIFKFQVIQNLEQYDDELSKEFVEALTENNLMVRLVNNDRDGFTYAFEKVELSHDVDDMRKQTTEFILQVCALNARYLKSLKEGFVKSNHKLPLNEAKFERMYNVFRKTTTLPSPPRLPRLPRNESLTGLMFERGIPSSPYEEIIREKVKEYAANNDTTDFVNAVMDFLSSQNLSVERPLSDDIAESMVNQDFAKTNRLEYAQRNKFRNRPKFQIEICRVQKSRGRGRVWGVRVHYSERTYDIHFGSINRTMLYICALLKQKYGDRLFRRAFYNNGKPPKGYETKDKEADKAWMKKVYKIVYLNDRVDEMVNNEDRKKEAFDDWYNQMANQDTKALNNAKCAANRAIIARINDILGLQGYCVIDTRISSDETNPSYFYIDVAPENILVDEAFETCVPPTSQTATIIE